MKRVVIVFSMLLSSLTPFLLGEDAAAAGTIKLTPPGEDWLFLIDLPDFQVLVNGPPTDNRRYVMAGKKLSGYGASVALERMKEPATFAGCQDFQARRVRGSTLYQNVRLWSEGDTAFAAYNIPEVGGVKVRQENLFACKAKGHVYIDIHLSKTLYEPGDEKLFAAILQTVRLEQASDNMKYWKEGAALYLKGHYAEAIAPFEKALELEKADPRLEKTYWYILVDDLGMAHGVTGNLTRAREVFEYGLSQDPNYPLFYYNLACVYAEMQDLDRAAEYLKEAFKRKENILPGERMPDPRKDDSFKPHLKNKAFRELLDSLVAASK
jgi:tetratricopeptide (TPR) repeat protein